MIQTILQWFVFLQISEVICRSDDYKKLENIEEISHRCEPNEFRCFNRQCVSKILVCDGDRDCSDGSDEKNCTSISKNLLCGGMEFTCRNDHQCIPKSYHCDHESDCYDGSDETDCSAVYIVKSPPPTVTLIEKDNLTLVCTAIGEPKPEISWRFNWGYVPKKCLSTSFNGTGSLVCPHIQREDQGTYSCEGMNIIGFVIAVPDTVVIVKSTKNCPSGQFDFEDECIPCFCFHHSTECERADLFASQMPINMNYYKINFVEFNPMIKIRSITNWTKSAISNIGGGIFINNSFEIKNHSIVYLELFNEFQGNQLRSYGGYLHYDLQLNSHENHNEAPAVIVVSNDLILIHKHSPVSTTLKMKRKIRFVYGEWYKQHLTGLVLASREDIMTALVDVKSILIKIQYAHSPRINISVNNIYIDAAKSEGEYPILTVEKCLCPSAYVGLSCETCAPGYTRHGMDKPSGQCSNKTIALLECSRIFSEKSSNRLFCTICACSLLHVLEQSCHLESFPNAVCDCSNSTENDQCEKCFVDYSDDPVRRHECRLNKKCYQTYVANSAINSTNSRCQCKIYVYTPKTDDTEILLKSSNIQSCSFFNKIWKTKGNITAEFIITELNVCLNKNCIQNLCENHHTVNKYSCICENIREEKICIQNAHLCQFVNPCLNGGTCRSKQETYKCDCAYGFTGQNCSETTDILNSVSFRGDGWLEIDSSTITYGDGKKKFIGFEISTNSSHGLIMCYLDKGDNISVKNFIILSIAEGYIQFQYNVTPNPITLRIISSRIDDGKRHRIILKLTGRNASMDLDGEYIVEGSVGLNIHDYFEKTNFFIGGIPHYFISRNKYFIGFTGCIHTLEIQDSGSINIRNLAVKGINVYSCSRYRWISSSLINAEIDQDEFDAFVPPPPVNIIYPRPTVNIAISFLKISFNVLFMDFLISIYI